MVNRYICLFHIPMPFSLLVLLDFCPLLSPPLCLLSEIFNSGSSIHSVLFMWDVCNFQLTDGEELWQSHTNMVQYFVLIHIDFLGDFDSYFPFGFQFLAWDHLNIIYHLPCFLSMGILLSPPKTFFSVRWMKIRNSILDLLILSYFTRIKKDFNVFIII